MTNYTNFYKNKETVQLVVFVRIVFAFKILVFKNYIDIITTQSKR